MNAKNPNTPPKKVTLFRHVFIPVSETRFVPKQCLFLRLIPQYSPARSILKFLALPSRMFLVLTILLLWMSGSIFCVGSAASFNLTLPHQHPDPDSVADELQRTVNASVWRRQMLSESKDQTSSCLTGNPIDDCWRCDPNWAANRQRLADCGIGFGRDAMGGKGGKIYIVTDSSDSDPTNPTPGTLRHAVIQFEPLWIIFSADMNIKLKYELIINNFKTIDGRGANVHITGGGCITIHSVSNIIIHNIHVHHCKPSGNANIRSTPTHVGHWGLSDGDGISIFDSRKIWIDHCSLSYCKDGLIDATMGSTGITISNSYFSHHDKVMLLGHDDKYTQDSGMQVTIAFNHFGEALSQRMPRCRYGYIHVVNNDFTAWEMYAIGGSARPTINSQGNRYTAPVDPNAKEVTKRLDTAETEWAAWNWRSEGDILVNGAFFVPSGAGLSTQYGKASSVEPKSVALINQLTMNAGVFGAPRYNVGQGIVYPGFNGSNHGDGDGGNTAISNSPIYGNGGGSNDEYYGMIFKGNGYRASSLSSSSTNLCIQIIIILYIVTNYSGLLIL